ncbi:MAG: PD-(D/E)XK nuclease family protein, partial [Acidimicrobiales bacterium]
IAAAIRAALAEEPGVFAPVAANAATEAALVGAYRELRDLSGEALDALAAQGRRAGDVVALHHRARGRLAPGFYDEEDLMDAAAEVLAGGSGAGSDLGTVVVYLPERLSRHGAGLIRAASRATEVVVLAGTTGDPAADAEVVASIDRLGVTASAPGPARPPVAPDGRTRLLTATDADEEAREAARAVVRAARDGVPLDRMAILHSTHQPYARLVHEHLQAAGIPANGTAVAPLAGRTAARTLLGVMALPEGGFARHDVFAWLSAGPVLCDGRPVPVSAWERVSREAGVVAGRDDWDARLANLAGELEARAEAAEADPDQAPSRAARGRAEAGRARDLRAFVLGLVDDLAGAAAAPRPWADHAGWALALLEGLLGDPGRHRAWPTAELRAADALEVAIHRLGALDGIEEPVGLEVFTRTLRTELEADRGGVGRLGEGVLVGSMSMGVGLDLDLVVVLGLAEGCFPTPVGEDSLLPDHERRAAGGELALAAGRVQADHRHLLANLAGSREAVLCVPRGDLRRAAGLVASRWALEAGSGLAGRRLWSEDLGGTDCDWAEHIASFEAGLCRSEVPATDQEHRLRALLAAGADPLAPGSAARRGDPVLDAGAEVVACRASPRFTRFDGNLVGVGVASPVGAVVSATRLERWALCPFSYLVEVLLGAPPVENPEDHLQITALDRGRLVHEVLERFMTEVLARPRPDQPGPGEPWGPSDRERLAAIAWEVGAEFEARGLTGRPIFWRRDRAHIASELARVLDLDDAWRRERRTRPLAAEVAFGFPSSHLPAVAVALADGRELAFRGRADRIDQGEAASLHILDYKTGRSNGFSALCEDDPDLGGTKLQLAVYGAAARALPGHEGA